MSHNIISHRGEFKLHGAERPIHNKAPPMLIRRDIIELSFSPRKGMKSG